MERYSATYCDGTPIKTWKDKLFDFCDEQRIDDKELLSQVKQGIVKSIEITPENGISVIYISGDESPLT